MTSIALLFACAGAIGLVGAALGVRNLKRQTTITIERGKPKYPLDVEGMTEDQIW